MGFSTLINDWKQQSTKFLHFLHLHHPWREERYIQHVIQLLCLMSVPSSEIPITQLSCCFRSFFPPHWSRRWNARTSQSHMQLGFDAFESVTSCCNRRQQPELRLWLLTLWVSIWEWKPLQCLLLSCGSLFSHQVQHNNTNSTGLKGKLLHKGC